MSLPKAKSCQLVQKLPSETAKQVLIFGLEASAVGFQIAVTLNQSFSLGDHHYLFFSPARGHQGQSSLQERTLAGTAENVWTMIDSLSKLVFATRNENKVREVNRIFASEQIMVDQILSLDNI